MPRFHFHLKDGEDSPDPKGIDLDSIGEARREALAFAGELLSEMKLDGPFARRWEMQVTDDRGLTLFLLDFSITESPATDKALRGNGT